MDKIPNLRKLDVFIYDGVNILDIASPVQAFDSAYFHGSKIYSHRFISLDGKPVRSSCGLRLQADAKIDQSLTCDDLIICGGEGINALLENANLLNIIRKAKQRAGDGRLISICSGAMLLAKAGVLDGLSATTHWAREKDIQHYPDVKWDLDRIFIMNERIYTSAGVTSGIDLALAIIQADCGNAVALSVARELIVQLRRMGGQSQYAVHLMGQFTQDQKLGHLIEKIIAKPKENWQLERLADEAGMNARTLTRHFNRLINITPVQFVERVRIDHARGMLSQQIPSKTIAAECGFGDLQRMRRAFQRHLGVKLSEYSTLFSY